MKIHVYNIVHDEEFLLPYYLRHYEKFADKIFIIDDHSTDNTAKIAKKHPKVEYSEYQYWGRFEKEINRTLQNYAKVFSQDADWVMCPDTDEFLYHPDLLSILQQNEGVLRATGYTMVSENLPTTRGQIYSELKMGVRTKAWDKPIIFQPSVNIKFGDGRHSAKPGGTRTSIKLLHYRYLSRNWTLERAAKFYPRFDMNDRDRRYRLQKALDFYDKISPDLKEVV